MEEFLRVWQCLEDLIISEPKARIGFAGKRVIKDTVKEDLPKDFQTAEKQLEKDLSIKS